MAQQGSQPSLCIGAILGAQVIDSRLADGVIRIGKQSFRFHKGGARSEVSVRTASAARKGAMPQKRQELSRKIGTREDCSKWRA